MLNIYVPFNDDDLVKGARHFSPSGDGGTNVCIHGTPSASLAGVGGKDTLFVLAHGRESTGTQIAGIVKGRLWGTRMATMTAAELAKALQGDKLSKSVGDIRLLVCWGGYVGGETPWGNDGDILQRKQGEAPFAGQLCSALKARGYSRMIVTGYRGTVLYSTKFNLTDVMVKGSDDELIGQNESFTRPFNDPVAHVKMVGDQVRSWISMDSDSRTVWY